MKNSTKIILLALVGLALVLYLTPLFGHKKAPATPWPEPNGYLSLVKAGQGIGTNSLGFEKLGRTELAALVATNAAAVQLARTGLTQAGRVNIEFAREYVPRHLAEISGLKRLVFAFAAEGHLAELEQRPNDAARIYIETLQLGTATARGGILIDAMISIAIESVGAARLGKITGQLDAGTARAAAAALETLDATREPWGNILNQEQEWADNQSFSIRDKIGDLIMANSLKTMKEKTRSRYEERATEARRLCLQLAARACELEKGAPPKNAADLVPDYLKAVPKDALTGADLAISQHPAGGLSPDPAHTPR